MKIPLFNPDEFFTEEGAELSQLIQNLLDPIVAKWMKAGYRTRDVEAIILNAARGSCLFARTMLINEG